MSAPRQRPPPRHPRRPHPQDPELGPPPRLRHHPLAPRLERRRHPGRGGLALPRPLPHGAAGWIEAEWGTSELGRKARFYRLTRQGPQAARGGDRAVRPVRRGCLAHSAAGLSDGRPSVGSGDSSGRSSWRDSVADEVDAELDFHLEMLTRELMERGMSPDAARAEALHRFGDRQRSAPRAEGSASSASATERRTEYLAELRQDAVTRCGSSAARPGSPPSPCSPSSSRSAPTPDLQRGERGAATAAAVSRRGPPRGPLVASSSLGDSRRILVPTPTWSNGGRATAPSRISVRSDPEREPHRHRQPDRLVGCFVTANTLRLLGARAALGRLFTDDETAEGASQRVAVLSTPPGPRATGPIPASSGAPSCSTASRT